MHNMIDVLLVRRLVSAQFPQWKDLPIEPVALSGWDNRTFHLGSEMVVRMPSAEKYASQVEKENKWLPILSPSLPLPIPIPLVIGNAGEGYPWKWSIYRWLDGETAAIGKIADLLDFATDLAHFFSALQRIDPTGGPLPGPENFYRGGELTPYDIETRQALSILKDKIDITTATEVWERALSTRWENLPIWVHGDICLGNLLVRNGRLCGIIDFGQLAIGDPACDLAIAWTLFKDKSREQFRTLLHLDDATWARARGWTLWKALILVSGLTKTNAVEGAGSFRIIDEVLTDHKKNFRMNR